MAREGLWRRLWLGLLALVWAVINVRAFDESDLYWHAAFGREIARQHTRTFPEPFSFAASAASSQEWLWDVATYILHARFGWNGVSVLVVALAALSAVAVASAAWEFREDATLDVATTEHRRPLAALIATTALVSPPILSRIRERPETAAMVLLPLILLFAHRLRDSKSRMRAAIVIAVAQLLFVQLHPLFVLGPVVVAIVAGPELALGPLRAQRTGLALVAACGLAFATNLPALAAVSKHLGGYSVQHVTDMEPPRWRHLDPTDSPFFPAYLAIGLASLAAMAKARRVFVRALVLALVGGFIAFRARRGVGPGAILAIPLAMASFGELFAGAREKAHAALAGALYVLFRTAQWFDASSEGGLGVMGVNPAAAPTAAARVLDAAPPDTHVLTTFSAGAPLSFLLDHRVRTFVDSRTPLVFGDAAYAEARAVWSSPDSLARATERYQLEAAVVNRDASICHQLETSPAWSIVMVEPGFATFARRAGPLGGARALTSFFACANGETRLRPDACKDPAVLDADLQAVAAASSQGFTNYLRALASTACSAKSFDADAAVRLLEPRDAARGFLVERDGFLAWVYAMAKHEDEVRALVLPHLDRPYGFSTPEPMFPALRALTPTRSSRALFELALADQDDAALGWLEAKVALACMADGDRDGTELHARRAAAFGAREVTPALCWLGDEGAKHWLDTLHQTCR